MTLHFFALLTPTNCTVSFSHIVQLGQQLMYCSGALASTNHLDVKELSGHSSKCSPAKVILAALEFITLLLLNLVVN